MAYSAMTRMYVFICTAPDPFVSMDNGLYLAPNLPAMTNSTLREHQTAAHFAVARGKTSLWVADLYEAWALYQFGLLVLELIESAATKQAVEGQAAETRAAANALLKSHKAVERLAWMGIISFLFVCVGESGWSLWLLTFMSGTSDNAKMYDNSMSQFTLAGFMASCAAIYNIW